MKNSQDLTEQQEDIMLEAGRERDYDCDPSGQGCKVCPRYCDDCDGKEDLLDFVGVDFAIKGEDKTIINGELQ